MKELQITIKTHNEKDFKQVVDYILYELSLGVKDNNIDIVISDAEMANVKFKLFEDL